MKQPQEVPTKIPGCQNNTGLIFKMTVNVPNWLHGWA